jgi:hypothetical protein
MGDLKMTQLIARQGDVGFVRGNIPEDAKRIPFRPFALGETTGHSHAVVESARDFVEMYEKDGETYVRALADAPIRHEDHDPGATTSILPAGFEGRVVIAREYDEETDFRPVAD